MYRAGSCDVVSGLSIRTWIEGRLLASGALAHLLRNRFYIGEVFYRGELHPGAQEPIVDRAIFQAVQDGLDAQKTLRRARLATSSGLLAGRLYDDRGNRLTPSHTNKNGLRYRYYVSQALLQNRKEAAESVVRIAAPDLEAIVIGAARAAVGPDQELFDRELIEAHVRSVMVGEGKVTIEMYQTGKASGDLAHPDLAQPEDEELDADRPVRTITNAWAPHRVRRAKSQHDDGQSRLSDASRGQLLLAIAKARRWMRDIAADACSFAEIATQEGSGERQVRFLAPLAFVSPVVVRAIADGRASADLTITSLVRSLPLEWVEQETDVLR